MWAIVLKVVWVLPLLHLCDAGVGLSESDAPHRKITLHSEGDSPDGHPSTATSVPVNEVNQLPWVAGCAAIAGAVLGIVACALYNARKRSPTASPIPQGHPTEETGQLHQLLDVLDDVGRLTSMNHELDGLLAAIADSARVSLDAAGCDVYLWDPVQRAFARALQSGVTDTSGFHPQADSGIGRRVMHDRRLWTRTDDERDSLPESCAPDAVAPLVAGSVFLGLLVLRNIRHMSPHLEKLLWALSSVYGLGIRNAQLFQRVEDLARRDGLTGLYNHATFRRLLEGLLHTAGKDRRPLSLVMSDIDHFKRFNDEFGHQTGDEVLHEVARVWKESLPENAIIARYGGEEYIAALPDARFSHAVHLAEVVRQRIEAHDVVAAGHRHRVTASFGVVEWDGPSESSDELVRRADQWLYAAKEAGRNRVRGVS